MLSMCFLRIYLLFVVLFFLSIKLGFSQYLSEAAHGTSQQIQIRRGADTVAIVDSLAELMPGKGLTPFNLGSDSAAVGKIILDIIKAYNQQDEHRLNQYINREYPVSFIFRRGATDNLDFSDSIRFKYPIPEYLPYSPVLPNEFTIQFGALPIFSCDTNEWDKESGIFCDLLAVDSSRSRTAKNEKKYELRDWSPQVITTLEELEKISAKVIVIDSFGAAFIFFLSKIQHAWHLTGIDRFEVCDA